MKGLKSSVFLKLLLGISFLCTMMEKGEAAELYAIVVTDTIAVNIGSSVEADLQKIDKEIGRIALYAELSQKKYILKGRDISTKGVLSTLRSLSVKNDDVIFFYFSGHGYRTRSKQSEWPNLFITKENLGIDFDFICREIEKKHPRLMVVFADVCNNIVPDIFSPPLVARSLASRVPSPKLKEAYSALYRETSGKILIAGARTGEYAWCTPRGALFTEAWVKSFEDEGELGNLADWQRVLERACTAIKEDQNPFFEIETYQKSPL